MDLIWRTAWYIIISSQSTAYSLLFRIKTEQHSFPEIQLFPNQGRENKYRVITCFLFNSLFILRFPFSLSDKDEKINTGLSLVSFSIVYFYWGFLLHCQIFFLPLGFLPAFLTEGEKKNNEICRLTQTCGICKLVLSSGQDQGTWYHLNVCVTITSLAHKAQQFRQQLKPHYPLKQPSQECYRVLVSLKSWPGQLLSLNPCLRPKILARMLFLGDFVFESSNSWHYSLFDWL